MCRGWFHFFHLSFFSSRDFFSIVRKYNIDLTKKNIQLIDSRLEIYYAKICVSFQGTAVLKRNNLQYHWHNYIWCGFEVCFLGVFVWFLHYALRIDRMNHNTNMICAIDSHYCSNLVNQVFRMVFFILLFAHVRKNLWNDWPHVSFRLLLCLNRFFQPTFTKSNYNPGLYWIHLEIKQQNSLTHSVDVHCACVSIWVKSSANI